MRLRADYMPLRRRNGEGLMKKVLITAAALACILGTQAFAMDISRSDARINVSGTAEAGSDVRLNVTSDDGELVWLDSASADGSGKYSMELSLPFEDKTKEYIFSVNADDTQNVKVEGTDEIVKIFKECSASEFDSLIQMYAGRFGFDIAEYQKITDKNTMYAIFKSCSVTDKASIINAYGAACGISLINEGNRGDVAGILEKYASYIAPGYLNDKSSMSKTQSEKFAVILSSADYSSISAFKSAYADALSKAKKNETNNTGGGGGGNVSGGKGGAVLPPQAASTPQPTQKPDDGNQSEDEPFSDISDVDWAHDSIIRLYKKGVINGRGEKSFVPNDTVTREEFTAMLVRCSGLKNSENTSLAFFDVLPDSWYAQSVSAAVENEIVFGISDSEFGAGSMITRQDCAVMCARLLKKFGKETDISDESFADDADIADYAKESVYMLKKLDILSGTGENQFEPLGICTRAMAAKIIDLLSGYLE